MTEPQPSYLGVRGDYHTVGLLVPQDEFERVAEAVLDATEELLP